MYKVLKYVYMPIYIITHAYVCFKITDIQLKLKHKGLQKWKVSKRVPA